jgi:diketogulonate reductase-like aldo/keto reductase
MIGVSNFNNAEMQELERIAKIKPHLVQLVR